MGAGDQEYRQHRRQYLISLDRVVPREEKEELAVFAVNRSLTEDVELSLDLRDFPGLQPKSYHILTAGGMKVTNTADEPWNVLPMILPLPAFGGGKAAPVLPPHSWNVLVFGKK